MICFLFSALNTILLYYIVFFPSTIVYAVISSCNHNNHVNINPTLIPFKAIFLICNKSTNYIDSREAGLMLDFIVKHYNSILKHKFIFIHDHEKSWHYPVNLYKRLKYLKDIHYIKNVNFGSLFCVFLQFGTKKNYDKMFNKTYEIDKFMRNNNFINISIIDLYHKKYIFPCCAVFIVDNSRITIHPKFFYINIRKGLKEYIAKGGNNYLSGNYMEYLWSIIFGIENISYPPDCSYRINMFKNKQ